MEGMNDPRWRKSSHSGSNAGGCVEAGNHPSGIAVRDTTNRDGGTLTFTAGAWERFTAALR